MLGLCVGVGYPLIITWNKNLPYSIQHQIATALKTKKNTAYRNCQNQYYRLPVTVRSQTKQCIATILLHNNELTGRMCLFSGSDASCTLPFFCL